MKKNDCNIVRALLPLYVDGSTSPESKEYVGKHLSCCESCRAVIGEMTQDIPMEEIPQSEEVPSQTLEKGMRKIRCRWLVSLVLVALLLGAGIYSWNQARGLGMSISNLKERNICDAFLAELKAGNYEYAYKYIDIETIRAEWEEDFFSAEELHDIQERGLEFFKEGCSGLREEGVTDFRYLSVYAYPDFYAFTYTITVGGKESTIQLDVTENGIIFIACGNGSLVNPDALAKLRLWSEYLWEDYAGCYYDPDKGYVPKQ